MDASLAAHKDAKGQTGATMLMRRGYIISMSKNLKINTRSSTESDVVGADDGMPKILWTQYIIESKGYNISDSIIYQENKSVMLLENIGKTSSRSITNHIKDPPPWIFKKTLLGKQ